MHSIPPISVLIRTFNSEATLQLVIDGLNCRSDDEIIVVDSGSTDRTLEIANRNGAITVVTERPFNYSRSLNDGFVKAKHPWVLVISSHCIPVDGKLLVRMRAVAASADPRLAVAYGGMSLGVAQRTEEKYQVGTLADWTEGRFKIGGNGLAMYRREAWERRPFNVDLPTAEDLDWFLWAAGEGWIAANVPDACAVYRNQGSLRHMFQKGILETHFAYSLQKKPIPVRSYRSRLWSFALNCGHLAKFWVQGVIGCRTFCRQVAHAYGIFHATKPGSRETSHRRIP